MVVIALGDASLVWPVAVVIAAWLLACEGRGAAAAWVTALLCCAGAVGLSKLSFMICDAAALPRPFSPSGHTAMTVLVWGGAGVTMARAVAPRGAIRRAVGLLGVSVGLSVACALVIATHHTSPEVVAGLLWSGCVLLAFAVVTRRADPRPPSWRRSVALAAPVAALLALTMPSLAAGKQTPSEARLRLIAARLAPTVVPYCPFGDPGHAHLKQVSGAASPGLGR